MRIIFAALLFSTVAACSPPPAERPAEPSPPPSVAPTEAPAADLGLYANTWDSAEYSRFEHTIRAAEPGLRTVRLRAETNSPGGETVAVYPIQADGSRGGSRIFFVVADGDGEEVQRALEIPAEGLAVQVAVENAGGRRHAGAYTLSVE